MSNGELKLHLGCFDKVLPGWINTDITPHIFVSRVPGLPTLLFKAGLLPEQRYQQHKQGIFRAIRYMNVTKKFPFADNTFEYVYSSHMLEHLFPQQADTCLREIYRVLKKGGILRISLPDLDRIVHAYNPQQPEEFLEDMYETKQKHTKNQHHWHYNVISLTHKLESIGFSEIYRCQFRQSRCSDIQQVESRPESLFVEAVK
jgi:ubiquinone/menaquinone biosynthesis C-methylase UbiE